MNSLQNLTHRLSFLRLPPAFHETPSVIDLMQVYTHKKKAEQKQRPASGISGQPSKLPNITVQQDYILVS